MYAILLLRLRGRRQTSGKEAHMGRPRGSSEHTRSEILKAARRLFAARGINEVTVRDIAAEAGVTHALVHRYFGTKEGMVAEILRREVQAASALSLAPDAGSADPAEVVRRMLLYGLTDASTTLLLIARAELAGLEPEKMVEPGELRPIGLLADWLGQEQAARTPTMGEPEEPLPDPGLVSAVIGGAVFALQILGPWLMTAVGLPADHFEKRREEIVTILLDVARCAGGLPGREMVEQKP
jgi:AcrR family transcriptional regulator